MLASQCPTSSTPFFVGQVCVYVQMHYISSVLSLSSADPHMPSHIPFTSHKEDFNCHSRVWAGPLGMWLNALLAQPFSWVGHSSSTLSLNTGQPCIWVLQSFANSTLSSSGVAPPACTAVIHYLCTFSWWCSPACEYCSILLVLQSLQEGQPDVSIQ